MAQGDTPVPGPSRSESFIAQQRHLDTPAILRGETAETGVTLDEREKNDETNQMSHNPQGINGLRLVSST